MSVLFRLSAMLNRFCWIGAAFTAIGVFVFNLGEWTLFGVKVYTVFEINVLILLFNAFLQNLIYTPIISGQAAKLAKQAVMLSGEEAATAGQAVFATEVIDAASRLDKTCHIMGALGSFVLYFFLGPRVGSPISEIASIAALNLLPLALVVLLQAHVIRMRLLDPKIYDDAFELYTTFDNSITSGRL